MRVSGANGDELGQRVFGLGQRREDRVEHGLLYGCINRIGFLGLFSAKARGFGAVIRGLYSRMLLGGAGDIDKDYSDESKAEAGEARCPRCDSRG